MRRTKPLIEFKGSTQSVIVVTLRSLHAEEIAQAAHKLFGDDTFFEGDAALLELGQASDEAADDGAAARVGWDALRQIFARHGLHVIGMRGARGARGALRESAIAAGLPDFPAVGRSVRHQVPQAEEAPATVVPDVASPSIKQPPPQMPAAVPALVVDRPLRSGQQVYARGGDLVVLAAVSSGAEIIADGSIHVYAPLRGRALAGAKGALDARIFTTRFEAELVSIAGVYRTFESGVPDKLLGQPVQIQLSERSGEGASKLVIVSLKTN